MTNALEAVVAAKFGEVSIEAYRKVIRGKSTNLAADNIASMTKLVIQVEVLGGEVKLKITDPAMEAELMLAAAIKTASIGKKDGLAPLLHETLVHTFDETAVCEVQLTDA